VKVVVCSIQVSLRVWFIFLLMFFLPLDLKSQELLTWDHLADVTFEEKYDEEIGGYWLLPSFGDNIKTSQYKIIEIEGYLINLDLDFEVIILSKNPYSSCFFCGMAGPETIVEIQLNDSIEGFKLDQRAKVHGELLLNKTDFDHFNYILKNAFIELID